MLWALREQFPLHFIVFKQAACHLPHEANVEQIFSRAKLLSDPNMDPHRLAILVMVAVNKKAYKPSVEAIKDMYYELFRGKPGADDVEELPNTAPARPRACSHTRASVGLRSLGCLSCQHSVGWVTSAVYIHLWHTEAKITY